MAHSRQCVCIPSPSPENLPWIREQPGFPDPTPSQTRALVPECSDFLASVSLAAVLGLIFVIVVSVLFSSGSSCVPASHLVGPARSFHRKLVQFQPLLASQPLATWWTLERSLWGHSQKEPVITVIAVAKEDASQTLLCFSSSLISLLLMQSQAQNVSKRLLYYKPFDFSWTSNSARFSGIFSIAVLIQRKGQSPYGVILGLHISLTGGGHLWEMVLSPSQMENEVTMHNEASTVAAEILQVVYRTGRVPETFGKGESVEKHLPVLQLIGDPYLEGGFVC
ncbi:hypothetical protein FKM82_005487 [Ascaphus truei]